MASKSPSVLEVNLTKNKPEATPAPVVVKVYEGNDGPVSVLFIILCVICGILFAFCSISALIMFGVSMTPVYAVGLISLVITLIRLKGQGLKMM